MRLAEHLDQEPKRRIVDEPQAALALALRRRFKAQARRVSKAIRRSAEDHPPDQPASVPLSVTMAAVSAFAGFSYRAADTAYTQAVDTVRTGGADLAAAQLGLDEDTEIPAYGRRAQAMTTQIDLTTYQKVLDAINTSFAIGAGVSVLMDTVDSIFTDAIDSRADNIAATEIAAAFNDGAKAIGAAVTSKGLGIEKSWNAEPDACEICQGNADDGWIDFDEDFSSGDDVPEAHPNCRCSLDLRTAED